MRRPAMVLPLCALLTVSACGSQQTITADPSASAYGTIRIASGVSDETKVAAYLYAEALHQAGYSTEIIDTGTNRADYLNQLEDKLEPTSSAASNDAETLDVVPDYSGELLMYLTDDGAYSVAYLEQATADASATATPDESPQATPSPQETSLNVTSLNSNDIHSSIQRLLPQGLELLNASVADPKHGLYVTRLTAATYKLEELGNLSDHCADLTFDMPQSYENSSYLSSALNKSYKCTPKTIHTDSTQSQRARNLITDDVQIADLRDTAPEVTDNNLYSLRDPSNIFMSQNITPVIRSAELPESAKNAINTISNELTNDQITKLLKLTAGDDSVTYENAAKFWLSQSQE